MININDSIATESPSLYQEITEKSFAVTGIFIVDCIGNIIPWLMAMFCAVLCDLLTGTYKALVLREEIRFSRMWRNTFGKMVTYFSFIVMVIFMQEASHSFFKSYDVLLIFFLIGLEVMSSASNILKTKGITLDFGAALKLLWSKLFNISKEEINDVIKDDKEDN